MNRNFVYYFCSIYIFMIIALFLAGCGGSDGGAGTLPSVSQENSGITTQPVNMEPVNMSETGIFVVTVNIPGNSLKNIENKIIPLSHYTLRIEITGENISGSLVATQNIESSGEHRMEIEDIPSGLNIATIEILDSSGNLLAQRKHGFYMMGGEVTGPEGISMGVGIDSSGNCNPQVIYIPVGTTLYFENQDYNNARTVSMNSGNVTIGPISAAETASLPDNPEYFHTESYTFNAVGDYIYDAGYGGDGTSAYKVVVYKSVKAVIVIDDPWGHYSSYADAMNSAFGGNWSRYTYGNVDVGDVFSGQYDFVFLEGGDASGSELNSFLGNNMSTIENWVSGGGSLFVNSAPDGLEHLDAPFDVNLDRVCIYNVIAVDVFHYIFQGPFTPAGTEFSGNFYSHSIITGSSLTPLIVNTSNSSQVILAERKVDDGFIMYGGITAPYFHNPAHQAQNLFANILHYGGKNSNL